MDRSRVEGFVDVDCVGEDGVVEANVHEVVHPLAGAVASRGAIRPIPELAAGTLQKENYMHIKDTFCQTTLQFVSLSYLTSHLLEGPGKLPLSEGVWTVSVGGEHGRSSYEVGGCV